MNIKSLLLGSAAALAVVSGAQAADAVVAAEPEPMEYVKVCDAYGTGYFYIPGTETCLKIGGQLRYEMILTNGPGRPGNSFTHHSRANLEIDAKNDSEWGTVYSWIRYQGDQNDSGARGTNFFYIFGIGGLEFSNFDSQWAKFFGYGGFTDNGGNYNDDWNGRAPQYISYTADFGSVKAYVALENNLDKYKTPARLGNKYMPDVDAGISGTFGDWQVAGGVGYDEADESFALKGLVAGNFGMFGVRVMPLYSDSRFNNYFAYNGFSAILGVQAKVTDTVTLANDLQFYDNGDWQNIANVNWQVASGFSVLLEGIYADRFNTKTKSGMLRFQRSF
jgi:opacity protein-like surface antigen